MINAEEMRELVKASELKNIEQAIKFQAERGGYSVMWYTIPSEEAIKILGEKGFKVSFVKETLPSGVIGIPGTSFDNCYISWSENDG